MHVETGILGSIQGEGKFMNLGMSSRPWLSQSTASHLASGMSAPDASATRRDHYEVPLKESPVAANEQSRAAAQHVAASHATNGGTNSDGASCSSQSHPQIQYASREKDPEIGYVASVPSQEEPLSHHESRKTQKGWRKRLQRRNSERKGYWDLLSFFRSSGNKSTTHYATQSEKIPDDV
ncbi:hypothetical protein ACLMJK_009114 [Lecanora helva]